MKIDPSNPMQAAGAIAQLAQGTAVFAPPVEAVAPIRRERDSLELSPEALELAGMGGDEASAAESESDIRGADGQPLTREEEREVRDLQARDREVRAHEEAHKAAAGDLALGGPTYEYQRAPDGQEYAVGGEVQIALKPGNTPEETVRNAQRARRAALAPAEPSGQDRKVAAEAAQMEAEARQEANEERTGDVLDDGSPGVTDGDFTSSLLDLSRRDEAYRATASFG
ncbi:MAG: putative metalloprotease CJM1_0395 family protein [Planctomycetota bacterium]